MTSEKAKKAQDDDEIGMLDKSKPKHQREKNGIFGFSFPSLDQVLDEIEKGDWQCFVVEFDQGGDNSLFQGTKLRNDTWTTRYEDWDTEISKEINEWPQDAIVSTIYHLGDCILWAEFA